LQATEVLPPFVETDSSPLKALLEGPVPNTVLFQSGYFADVVHLFQLHSSILLPASYQEFTVQRNKETLEDITHISDIR
jgi:hypothetical protein